MIHTLENVLEESIKKNPLHLSRILRTDDRWSRYKLERSIMIRLSNGDMIIIPRGFKTDISSVPRLFWVMLAPDGDFALAAIIHDYLYINKLYDRKFNDKEMLLWSKALYSTKKWSIHNIDNYTRYYMVRLFGWTVWNKPKNLSKTYTI